MSERSEIAIRVENLGKCYRIGRRRASTAGATHRLMDMAMRPFRYLWETLRGPTEEELFWALKDVSFEIKRGEVVGIIGPNGAGKSTLLKILSRITAPTTGMAEIRGRVASLLEVGTGFHPELTGRENIYLSGMILGMKRAEIDARFEEIVDFAGIERFLDTPVKRYSSGMYVRLGFAIAAHLRPDILLVDEVLAVGDAEFQRRCLGKMEDVAHQGRTVLFVSHNMPMVQALCTCGILLRAGQICEVGSMEYLIKRYLLSDQERNLEKDRYHFHGFSSPRKLGPSLLASVWIEDEHGNRRDTFLMGETITCMIKIHSPRPIRRPILGLSLRKNEIVICSVGTDMVGKEAELPDGLCEGLLVFKMEHNPFTPGLYFLSLSIFEAGEFCETYDPICSFEIRGSDIYGSGRSPGPEHGFICAPGRLAFFGTDSQQYLLHRQHKSS